MPNKDKIYYVVEYATGHLACGSKSATPKLYHSDGIARAANTPHVPGAPYKARKSLVKVVPVRIVPIA